MQSVCVVCDSVWWPTSGSLLLHEVILHVTNVLCNCACGRAKLIMVVSLNYEAPLLSLRSLVLVSPAQGKKPLRI